MARRISLLSVLGVLLLANVGEGARAAALTQATWFQVAQGMPLTRTRLELGATGAFTGTSIAVTLSYPFLSTNFFVPKTPNGTLDLAIKITQGGPQAITATAGMANGTPGIPGTVIVMTAAHVLMGANRSMFQVGVNTLVAVPLSNGKAGQHVATFTILQVLHTITVDFYAWTPGSVVFTGLTTKGLALPNVTAAGSFQLTSYNTGPVTLVSPSKVSIDGLLAQRRTASFTTLKLFFPEPSAWLLLGAGALALGLGARRTRR